MTVGRSCYNAEILFVFANGPVISQMVQPRPVRPLVSVYHEWNKLATKIMHVKDKSTEPQWPAHSERASDLRCNAQSTVDIRHGRYISIEHKELMMTTKWNNTASTNCARTLS